MFSVQQKRDISDAVQKILRATAHPELPTSGEISFTLKIVGAESWSFAEIANNASVGDPGLNPHNELMASLPEEEARSLISKAQDLPLPMPDPRNTPEEFFSGRWLEAYKEMVKAETAQLLTTISKMQRQLLRLQDRDKIKDTLYSELSASLDRLDTFITPIREDNLIQHHSDQIRCLKDRLDSLVKAVEGFAQVGVDSETRIGKIEAALGATADSDANALLSLPDRMSNLETAVRQLGNQET